MIKNFTLQTPTKIIFGRGAVGAIKREIPDDKRIMLVYGCNSLKANGIYHKITDLLGNRLVCEFSGIGPDPEYEKLLEAVKLINTNKVDYILAAGGGSVIDAAKFIAMAAQYDGEPWNIVETFGACARTALPIATIVTLPASGSEVNRDAVISRASKKAKLPMGNPCIYPQFSILDPELTFTLPAEQTANGILDIFVHVLEQYLTVPVNGKLQDRFAEGILQTLIEEAPIAMKEPANYEARSNIMISASMAMNGFLRAGVPMDWASHMISHEITSLLGIPHARALAIVVPPYLNYCKNAKKEKLLQYGKRVWGIDGSSDDDCVALTIKKTVEFFESLGFKTSLKDYGISSKEIEKIVKLLSPHKMVKLGENRSITPEVVRVILESAA